MKNKKRIEILEDLVWDLLRTIWFDDPNSLGGHIIKGFRKYMEDNLPHIRKKLKKNHTRTLTRHTEG